MHETEDHAANHSGKPTVARVRLVVRGSTEVREVDISPGQTLTVGRAPTCSIAVDDPALSRTHARIVREGSLVSITDLDSRNGTWLGQGRVRTAFIGPGVPVRMGALSIEVAHDLECDIVPSVSNEAQPDLRGRLRALEQEEVLRALDAAGGSQRAAAERLGLALRTFERRLQGARAARRVAKR